jgi:hypothetical protein
MGKEVESRNAADFSVGGHHSRPTVIQYRTGLPGFLGLNEMEIANPATGWSHLENELEDVCLHRPSERIPTSQHRPAVKAVCLEDKTALRRVHPKAANGRTAKGAK